MLVRLLRKLLPVGLRTYLAHPGGLEDLFALHAEAQRLVEDTDNEAERWQLRVVDLFLLLRSSEASPTEEVERLKAEGLAAAVYSEERGERVALSVALDAYSAVAFRSAPLMGCL